MKLEKKNAWFWIKNFHCLINWVVNLVFKDKICGCFGVGISWTNCDCVVATNFCTPKERAYLKYISQESTSVTVVWNREKQQWRECSIIQFMNNSCTRKQIIHNILWVVSQIECQLTTIVASSYLKSHFHDVFHHCTFNKYTDANLLANLFVAFTFFFSKNNLVTWWD